MVHSVLNFFLTDIGIFTEVCLVMTGTTLFINKLSSH